MLPNQGTRDQVIVHWPSNTSGRFQCDNWGPLPFSHPAMISIVPTDSSGPALNYAQQLAHSLSAALVRMSPSVQRSSCGGPGPAHCRGHGQSAATCVLALVGDSRPLNDYTGAVALWASKIGSDHRYRVVPISPPSGRATMASGMLSALQVRKVFEWTRSSTEAVPVVLGAADLISRDYRVFISYRQEDGDQHADDLFGALSLAGFDVFLDRVRIGVGAHIPDRIREELAHKAVVLVLETPLVGKSDWVAQEVAIAAKSRLGILAVHFPNGTRIGSLSDRRRHFLTASDFDGQTGRLITQAIDDVGRRVADLHSFWLVRRRYQIQRALSNALLHRGVTNQRLGRSGCLDVVPRWGTPTLCSIKTCARMAELEDFRELDDTSALPGRWHRAVLAPGMVGPGDRPANMQWLSDKLMAGLFDESEISRLAGILSDSAGSELK